MKRDQPIFCRVAHDTHRVFAAFYSIDLGFEHLAVDQDPWIRRREVLVVPLVIRTMRILSRLGVPYISVQKKKKGGLEFLSMYGIVSILDNRRRMEAKAVRVLPVGLMQKRRKTAPTSCPRIRSIMGLRLEYKDRCLP